MPTHGVTSKATVAPTVAPPVPDAADKPPSAATEIGRSCVGCASAGHTATMVITAIENETERSQMSHVLSNDPSSRVPSFGEGSIRLLLRFQSAVTQVNDPVRVCGDGGVMRDHENRLAFLAKAQKELHDVRTRATVQTSRGLVGQE